jgi:lysophospholipase L1-like esterase
MKKWLWVLAIAGILTFSTAVVPAQLSAAPQDHWVATWATSEQMAVTPPDRPVLPPNIKMPDFRHMKGVHGPPPIPTITGNQTVRQIVHISIPGQKIRVELSNAFGKSVVSIGDAHVALRTSDSSIDSDSDRPLTFSGRKSVDIQPGAVIVSDPVDLDVKPMSDLAISLYVTKAEGQPTNHTPGLHTAYISTGDTTASASMPSPATNTSYVWLRSVDVEAPPASFAISCLGDSITDGFRTTVDANTAWPTLLAKRFSERQGGPRIAVLNAGISGNQVLRDGAGVSALARFDRDVASEPGVRWVVLLEAINDINIHGQITGPGALTAEDLIAGYKQLIARAHMDHIKIMGATLTPDEGVWLAGPVGEATRAKVNDWIRNSGAFDAVVDFDAVERDPSDPKRMLPQYDSGDHIHPNDAGNAAMANAFDLSAFTE